MLVSSVNELRLCECRCFHVIVRNKPIIAGQKIPCSEIRRRLGALPEKRWRLRTICMYALLFIHKLEHVSPYVPVCRKVILDHNTWGLVLVEGLGGSDSF